MLPPLACTFQHENLITVFLKELTGSLLFTTVVSWKASRQARNIEPWGGGATEAEDHTRFCCFQPRTGIWAKVSWGQTHPNYTVVLDCCVGVREFLIKRTASTYDWNFIRTASWNLSSFFFFVLTRVLPFRRLISVVFCVSSLCSLICKTRQGGFQLLNVLTTRLKKNNNNDKKTHVPSEQNNL